MFKSLFKKQNAIEAITEKISNISTSGKSPMEKWLDLEDENKAELYMYHFIYGWLFIQDNNLIEMSEDNIKYYFNHSYKAINRIVPSLEVDVYFGLYSDRFEKFRKELSNVRDEQFSAVPYFPKYFFSRVCNYPLLKNEVMHSNFTNEEWSEMELAGMFPHQINYLQDNLKKSF